MHAINQILGHPYFTNKKDFNIKLLAANISRRHRSIKDIAACSGELVTEIEENKYSRIWFIPTSSTININN
jgi:hypothetical protein